MTTITQTNESLVIKKVAINDLNLDIGIPTVATNLLPDINTNETLKKFFDTHFTDTRKGKYTKSCKFTDRDASVKTKVLRYLTNRSESEFLKLSKELTQLLFTIMKGTSSTSNGKYFVMEVAQESGEEWLFLIKLDPKNGVQVKEDLTLEVLADILPDSNDKVHKCAIIRFNTPQGEEAELYVLDRQQKEGEPAKFFLETYLQATELLNDGIITKKVMNEARSQLLRIVPNVKRDDLIRSVDKEFQEGRNLEIETSINNILNTVVPESQENRSLFISNTAADFTQYYLQKYPDHNSEFIVKRTSNTLSYKDPDGQIYFRFNSGISDKIRVQITENEDTVITINKELRLKLN